MRIVDVTLIGMLVMAAGSAHVFASQNMSSVQGATSSPTDARYVLRPGDVLDLNFPFVPAFNQTLAVHPDGHITLRVVGDLRVTGMSLPELTEIVRSKYASVLRDPVVTIELKEFEKPYFIVAGEVERPGKYELGGEVTVSHAVALAGGVRADARQSKVAILRRRPDGSVDVTPVDLQRILREGRLERDARLAPGDLLFVPKGRRFDLSSITSSLWVLAWLP